MHSTSRNLAAIDIGTNSFHLIIVSVKEDGNFEIIDREREVIRLGEGSSGDIKLIRPEAIERAIESLQRFKGIADSHNAQIRAVATSAVRESYNKNDFIDLAFKTTGIEVEVISGYEEARLIYLGILKAVPAFNKKVLLIDIGGGSTEFLIGKKGNSIQSVSLKLGAVRLTQKFFPDFQVNSISVKKCMDWVEGELFQTAITYKKEGFQMCIGSSGTIMTTGLIINAMMNKADSKNTILNNFVFTKDELVEVEKEILKRKSVEKRKKIPGMDDKRADIMPAGIIILRNIFDMFEIDKMSISGYALREGIVIDTLQKLQNQSKPGFEDIRKDSVENLG